MSEPEVVPRRLAGMLYAMLRDRSPLGHPRRGARKRGLWNFYPLVETARAHVTR